MRNGQKAEFIQNFVIESLKGHSLTKEFPVWIVKIAEETWKEIEKASL